MRLLLQILVNGLALWVAGWILPGITVSESGTMTGNETLDVVLAYLFIGLVFGVVNALVRPIVRLLALPLTILTLGLFSIIINAGMLMLTSWLTSFTPVHFAVDSFFWTAILASIIISIVSMVAGSLTGSRR
ncbi:MULTISPECIES: phage holin family protein [Arthrobacter]|uniref:Phage holin family protein n=1 Tax=Arthrobacter caoxuetaonis TaxID=2886935 RepID=A0A9X1MF54_9MICC|nr:MULTISPECIES: phage holin family protein [Arthrobacter]MCC3281891.1 phage holin family protein [Arthrobacter caoxuetaonis]MCC3283070.1 phage holin family protein [Arthrobacter caoxuetaonis]MCC3298187.1 phage holin family protein [Arthrobacter caoxuetaonis]MCC9194666.1 phage holin family protein [Arthrobacter sp. zg-Y916]USQ57190.1 phage holin family protein [Arthrobacter caoxuetaonis]